MIKDIRKEGEGIGTVQRICQNQRQEVHDVIQKQIFIRIVDL